MLNLLYGPTLTSIHDYWKNIALTRQMFVAKIMSLLFTMLSRMIITFFSTEQMSFNFMAEVPICSDFEAQEKVFHYFPSICHGVIGLDAMIFVF